ncbi:SDR family NAD(P)-dependent oxidoreductase [Paenibacillus gorillae]|uniref:SDR family NAD(P)-dependent oxidoreductase n=1 Tax=Paenibacillus gorillae TaxID=1243662 RepID=UPI0004B70259|nr:SDR family NAD(P)-dependent oxidoreductase [Paenibacillus gorillae]
MSKVWLITGSGSGLGRSIAEAALAKGERVVATARNIEQLDDLVKQYGDQIRTFTLDVTVEEAAQAAVQLALDAFGRLDVLVNNAGYGDIRPFEETSSEDFKRLMDTCFYGVVYLTRAALPIMRQQRSGHILQISSVGGRLATPGSAAYHAAKWAIGGFTEALAMETAHLGVKISALEPGGMRTNWVNRAINNEPQLHPDYEASVGQLLKMMNGLQGNEKGDPVKVAEVVLQLAYADELPAHLLLGKDAVQGAQMAEKQRAADAERWHEVSLSTEYE